MRRGFEIWANPSSPHAEGRAARAALEEAREHIKAMLGWEGELIFTSGASEALAIGLGHAKAERRLVSAVEHDAVFRAAPDAEVLPVADGTLDPEALADALARPGRPVVALQSINSETGTVMIPHGGTPDLVKNHPALKGLDIPPTGRPGNNVGTLVTKTLLIAGEGNFGPTPSGTRGAMLRAYDKATGQEVGAYQMPAPQTGSPMTYMVDGRQYLVIAISGPAYSGELLALRLPRP